MTDVQDLLNNIRSNFIDELPDKIDQLETLAINHAQSDNIQEIYRHIHSLKGNGGTLNIPIITSICHQYESFLSDMINNDMDDIFMSVSLSYIDLLRDTYNTLCHESSSFEQVEKKLLQLHESSRLGKVSILASGLKNSELLILKKLLAKESFIRCANNGIEAYESLTHEYYDLFITSLEMPGLTGPGVIDAIKNNNGLNRNIKSILLTSNKNSNEKMHADYIVTKDSSLSENLANALNNIIDKKNMS